MSIDLTTEYLGMRLANPLVASASPLTGSSESLRTLEDHGVSAAVLPSLFEEQIEHEQTQIERLYSHQAESFAESLTYFPEIDDVTKGPQAYLELVREAKKAVSIPIIASLNGHTVGGWTRYGRMLQEAGADALELNIYYVPTDCGTDAEKVEQRYADLVASLKQSIGIPLSVKFGPQFTSIPHFAYRLMTAGADGLVLFNRFLEPDIDTEMLQFRPELVLSERHEVRVPLRWIAILRDQVACSLAATSGVHDASDVARVLLVGADVAMTASTLLTHGPAYARTLLEGLSDWMAEQEYDSVTQLKGSMSHANCPDPSALERGNYMRALTSYTPDYWARD